MFLCHRRSASLTPHSRLAPECTLHSVAHHSHTLFVLVPPKRPRSTQRPLLACSARVQCHCPSRSYSGSSQWFWVRAPTHWITTTRASLTPCSPQHSSTRRCPAPTAPQSALPPKARSPRRQVSRSLREPCNAATHAPSHRAVAPPSRAVALAQSPPPAPSHFRAVASPRAVALSRSRILFALPLRTLRRSRAPPQLHRVAAQSP